MSERALIEIEKLGSKAPCNLPDINYDKLVPNRRSKAKNGICSCGFCQIGRLNGQDYTNHCNGIRAKPGRPSALSSSVKAEKYCGYCKSRLAKGLSH